MREIDQQLMQAVKQQNPAEIKKCLTAKANVNIQDERNGVTPLIIACQLGNEEIVDILLDTDEIDINHKKNAYGTALTESMKKGHTNITKKLLAEKLIDIDAVNFANETPLVISVIQNDIDTFNLLIKKKPNLNTQSYFYGTALTAAVFFERDVLVQALLVQETKFDTNQHPGAFLWAIRKNDLGLVQQLIQRGANVNETSEQGFKNPPDWVWSGVDDSDEYPFTNNPATPNFGLPLSVAFETGNKEMIKTLLRAGADPNRKEENMQHSPEETIQYFSTETQKIIREAMEEVKKEKSETANPNQHGFFAKTPSSTNPLSSEKKSASATTTPVKRP